MKGGFRVYLAATRPCAPPWPSTIPPTAPGPLTSTIWPMCMSTPLRWCGCDAVPEEKSVPKAIGRHLDGCRIGFDAGGSDRKVSAVIDGESVFSEEVVWFPKTNSDPDYHYDGIVAALKSAAEHMPRVDAVGVSSAGIYIDNRTMVASLFLKVPKEHFDAKVKDIYIRAITRHLRRRALRGGQRRRRLRSGRRHEPGGQQRPGHRHGHQRGRGLRGRGRQHHRLAQRAGLRARWTRPPTPWRTSGPATSAAA